ncbi:hypothetical protein GH714_043682 [Hevea brasiliensis]|uniref:Uncharacterized protein n=1 Tax=Hevea brasiliensis TaxID=3981 RepID=A0A6A6K3Q7_HEVBR|nr:hypothetical protein GH714_043682 [Hevea brasiliensis]
MTLMDAGRKPFKGGGPEIGVSIGIGEVSEEKGDGEERGNLKMGFGDSWNGGKKMIIEKEEITQCFHHAQRHQAAIIFLNRCQASREQLYQVPDQRCL